MKKDIVRIVVNSVLAVTFFTVWILSFFFWRDATLGGSGWSDLKYFTVESNLLVGVVSLVWLILRLVKGKEGLPKWLTYLKYLSAVSVFVTFAVVVVFLGPVYGYGKMYYGSNLFFHLLIPLAAIGEFALFEEGEITFPLSFTAMLPLSSCSISGWTTYRSPLKFTSPVARTLISISSLWKQCPIIPLSRRISRRNPHPLSNAA